MLKKLMRKAKDSFLGYSFLPSAKKDFEKIIFVDPWLEQY